MEGLLPWKKAKQLSLHGDFKEEGIKVKQEPGRDS